MIDDDYRELEREIQQLRRFIDEELATLRHDIDSLQEKVALLEKK